jgi:hypothetical protein
VDISGAQDYVTWLDAKIQDSVWLSSKWIRKGATNGPYKE